MSLSNLNTMHEFVKFKMKQWIHCVMYYIFAEAQSTHTAAKVVSRRLWTEDERKAVHHHMATFIRMGKCPGRNDCVAAVKDPRLTTRSWKNIKYCVKTSMMPREERTRRTNSTF